MIKGFIFDLDGVITDTAEFHYLAWKQLATEEGMYFDKKINERLKGVSRQESLQIILDENKKDIPEDLKTIWANKKNTYYVELIKSLTPKNILEGIPELLNKLKKKNIKIALGSASKNAVEVLERLEILNFFDVVGDGNSVKNSKPAPDIFLHVAQKMKLEPCECIVVEDAEAGVKASKLAGCSVVGIGSKELLNEADYIYASPKNIILEEILND